MQWVPTKMHSRGKRLHEQLAATYGGMIKDIERRMRAGEEVPDCLAKTMIELRESEGLDDLDMAILASAFMIGGVETVSVGLFFFFFDSGKAAGSNSAYDRDRRRPLCSGSLR